MTTAIITPEQFQDLRNEYQITNSSRNAMIVACNAAVDKFDEHHNYALNAFSQPAIKAMINTIDELTAQREDLHKQLCEARKQLFPEKYNA